MNSYPISDPNFTGSLFVTAPCPELAMNKDRAPLSTSAIERFPVASIASGQRVELQDTQPRGLALRINPAGVRTFYLLGRIRGQISQIRIRLGEFDKRGAAEPFDPTIEHPILTLNQARERANYLLKLMRGRIDPREAMKAAREAAAADRDLTLERVIEQFLEAKDPDNATPGEKVRPSSLLNYKRSLLGDDLKALRRKPFSAIEKADLRSALAATARRAPAMAHLQYSILRIVGDWADKEDLGGRLKTALAGIAAPASPTARDRFLSLDELRVTIEALDDLARQGGKDGAYADIFRLLIATGARASEIAELSWVETTLGGAAPQIDLPAIRCKNGLPHLIPLSGKALAILERRSKERSGEYVFPARNGKPLSNLGVFSRTLRSAINERMASLRAAAQDQATHDRLDKMFATDWTPHDLRRTFSTHLNGELKIPPHVVEACINHVSGAAKSGVAGTYNRASYLSERRDALAAWDRFLADLIDPNPSNQNILHFSRK